MTARRRAVDAILRIIAEPSPAAYYACAVCPYHSSAKGPRTAAFAATVRTRHRAECPGLERTTAA